MKARHTWIFGVLLLLAAGGCGDDSSSQSDPLLPAVTAKNVQVVTGELADTVEVQTDQLIFPRQGADWVLKEKKGDVLVGRRQSKEGGKNPYGFLRKVKSVSTQGKTIVVQTEQASLEDALEQGEIRFTHHVGTPSRLDDSATFTFPDSGGQQTQAFQHDYFPQGTGGLAGGQIDISGKLFDGQMTAGATARISRGTFKFDSDLDMGLKIQWFHLEEFHAILSGEMLLEMALEVSAKAAIVAKKWDVKFFEVKKPLPVIMVGPVPVEVTLQFTVSGGGEITFEDKLTLNAGAGAKSFVSLGGRYEKGSGWSSVAQNSFSFYPIGPDVSGTSTASIKGILPKVTVSLLLYDTAGPQLSVNPYAKASVQGIPSCEWDISAGLEGSFGAKVQIPVLGTTLADPSLKLFDVKKSIINGVLPLPGCTKPDAGADATLDAALDAAEDAAAQSEGGSSESEGGSDAAVPTVDCPTLASQSGWDNAYCEWDGNGACNGNGPATTDCDHCCTGYTCTQLVRTKGWTSLRCEADGNNACRGKGVPTFDCEFCCGSTCNVDTDCGSEVCAWNGLDYCCQPKGASGETCFTDKECSGDQVCLWNGTKFVCGTPNCVK